MPKGSTGTSMQGHKGHRPFYGVDESKLTQLQRLELQKARRNNWDRLKHARDQRLQALAAEIKQEK